jgi:hypothetical protein
MRFISCVLVCGAALLVGAGAGCKKRPEVKLPPPEEVKVPEKKPPEQAKQEEQKPDLKRPEKYKGLVYNIRMAARRPEIENDLKEIGTFYQIDAASGNPPKTWEALKASMRTANKLVQKIEEEKVYVIMLDGKRLQPTDLLAYEKEASSPANFVVVRAGGQVEHLEFEELAKILGIKENK